jgi:hypothetical protein
MNILSIMDTCIPYGEKKTKMANKYLPTYLIDQMNINEKV